MFHNQAMIIIGTIRAQQIMSQTRILQHKEKSIFMTQHLDLIIITKQMEIFGYKIKFRLQLQLVELSRPGQQQ